MRRNAAPSEALMGGRQEASLSIHARLEDGRAYAVFTPDVMELTPGPSAAVFLTFDLLNTLSLKDAES